MAWTNPVLVGPWRTNPAAVCHTNKLHGSTLHFRGRAHRLGSPSSGRCPARHPKTKRCGRFTRPSSRLRPSTSFARKVRPYRTFTVCVYRTAALHPRTVYGHSYVYSGTAVPGTWTVAVYSCCMCPRFTLIRGKIRCTWSRMGHMAVSSDDACWVVSLWVYLLCNSKWIN